MAWYKLVMSRYTENTEPIFYKIDTDIGIWNTEKYRIPTIKY